MRNSIRLKRKPHSSEAEDLTRMERDPPPSAPYQKLGEETQAAGTPPDTTLLRSYVRLVERVNAAGGGGRITRQKPV
jgi:hypothetical protein